jgi:hypothetical protein
MKINGTPACERIGERIAKECLQRRAHRRQRRAHQSRHHHARQTQTEKDRARDGIVFERRHVERLIADIQTDHDRDDQSQNQQGKSQAQAD